MNQLPGSKVFRAVAGHVAAAFLFMGGRAFGQDLGLSATRPTIANSAAIQDAGVVQVEVGYDAYPHSGSGNSATGNLQTVGTAVYYSLLPRLRLDFAWSPYEHQQQDDGSAANGVSTINLGGKVELKKEDYHKWAPGVAVQYEAELPTASQSALQNYGQQAILLINHHYGKDGILDVIVNGSIVQAGCQTATGCSYGGQQSLAFSYHLQEKTRLYAEVFGQNNSESNTPPGTYLFGGFYHQFGDAFGINGGMRFGVSSGSARVGTTVGLVFGKRVRGKDSGK